MQKRIILIMAMVILSFSLSGCDNKQNREDKTSDKQEAVWKGSGDNITEQPEATIKPVEKLDILWLEPGIIPQESIKLEIETEPGSTHTTKSEPTGTAILVQICEKIEDMGYEIEVKEYGLIDDNGKKIFQNTYDYISSRYGDDELILAGNNSRWNMKFGYVDQKGNEVIAFEYDDAADFSNRMAKVGKRDKTGKIKYGYIDSNGKEVVPCEYDEAGNFSNGLASVAKYEEVLYDGNKYEELRYGFIDKTGKIVIPLKYKLANFFEQTDFFENPIAKVQYGLKQGYIDTTGKTVIPIEYSLIDDYMCSEGLFQVEIETKEGLKEGYINTEGKEAVPFVSRGEYAYGSFSEGLVAKAKKKGDSPEDWKVEFLDREGNVVIPINEWYIGTPNSNPKYVNGLVKLAKTKEGGKKKWGFLDKNGTEVIPAEYDMADAFNDVVTRVGMGEEPEYKYGALDRNGEIVIPIQYDEMTSFTEGLSVVGQRTDGEMKYGVFDTNGKKLIEMECDEIHIINRGRYGYVRKGEEYGIFKNPYYKE